MRLLVEPERIRQACDPFASSAWKHAAQMTRGVDDLLVADAFAARGSVGAHAERLRAVCEGNVEQFATAIAAEPLKITAIPKKEPWEQGEDLGAAAADTESMPGSKVPHEVRDIAIRSVFGRCVSNHLAAILTDCVDPLLPEVAIAYCA